MYSFLLTIIYVAFISLGLPDSLLGSAWPVMQQQLDVPVSFAGIISMIIAIGTVVSSLASNFLTKRIGTGKVTAISVLLTAVALFGFSASDSFILLCVWAIPYGLGAGAVDAALNNYVAVNCTSRHMSWLHCFWGVGAAVGPYIMGYCLTGGNGWTQGYRIISIVQIILTIILFITLPLWKKVDKSQAKEEVTTKSTGILGAFKIRGVIFMLITFFAYSVVEQTSILWASSYLVECKDVSAGTAASFASLFVVGITLGRFVSGFVADKLGDKQLIRIGIYTIIAGIIMVVIPIQFDGLALFGLVVIGFGCAPTYPAIIHSTPYNFGEQNSQAVIGIQMASAYIGTTFMPPLFGVIASNFNIGFYPFYILLFALVMLIMSESLNKIVSKRNMVKQ